MAVRQYIGARYIPLFDGDWDNTKNYEPLTIVNYQGNSYTSRQAVPAGIAITNTDYWIETGNYNAQIEAYRQEVLTFNNRIAALEADGSVTNAKLAANAVTGSKIADGAVGYSKISDNLKKIVRNNGTNNLNCITISDSYGRGVGSNDNHGWPYYLDNFIDFNYLLNVSNSGAGFVDKGHSDPYGAINFSEMITWAYDHLDSSISNIDIDLLIIAGGFNDHDMVGIAAAAQNTANHARELFPNARVMFFPLCAADRELDGQFLNRYTDMCYGCARGGAQVYYESLFWLYPFETATSYGDQCHPNNQGYNYIGSFMAGCIIGGSYPPNTFVLGASGEGFQVAAGATNLSFRTGVQNGFSFMGGRISRTGMGDLVTVPTYCRPRQTLQFIAYAYADASHQGLARGTLGTDGLLTMISQLTGTYDATLEYTFYIDTRLQPLGRVGA